MDFKKVLKPLLIPVLRVLISRLFVALGSALITLGYAPDQALNLQEALSAASMFVLSYVSESAL